MSSLPREFSGMRVTLENAAGELEIPRWEVYEIAHGPLSRGRRERVELMPVAEHDLIVGEMRALSTSPSVPQPQRPSPMVSETRPK